MLHSGACVAHQHLSVFDVPDVVAAFVGLPCVDSTRQLWTTCDKRLPALAHRGHCRVTLQNKTRTMSSKQTLYWENHHPTPVTFLSSCECFADWHRRCFSGSAQLQCCHGPLKDWLPQVIMQGQRKRSTKDPRI